MKYLQIDFIPGRLVFVLFTLDYEKKNEKGEFGTLYMIQAVDRSFRDYHRIEIFSFFTGDCFWITTKDIEHIQLFPYQMQDILKDQRNDEHWLFDRMHLVPKVGHNKLPRGVDKYRERAFLLINSDQQNHSYTSGKVISKKVSFEELIKNYIPICY